MVSRLLIVAALSFMVPINTLMSQRTLPPCPDTPNCVSTDAQRSSQRMDAIAFTDSPAAALARAGAALLEEKRTTIVEEGADYLKAEARSLIFRFVDDIEIIVDAERRVFRFRSASRVGKSDLGVNRRRMERISERLRTSSAAASPP